MDKSKLLGNLLIILVVAVILVGITYFYSFLIIKPYSGFDHILVIEDKVYKENPYIIRRDQVLVNSKIIRKEIDPYLQWDEKAEKVTLTTKNKTIRLKTDSLTAMVNAQPVQINIPATKIGDSLYIPVEFLTDFFGIEVSKYLDMNRVVVDKGNQQRKIGVPLEWISLKIKPSVLSPVYAFVDSDDVLYVYGETEEWYSVRTMDGVFGYVKKDLLEVKLFMGPVLMQEESEQKVWKPAKGKINLVWDYIYKKTPNVTERPPIKGLDVVSPTWFSLTDEEGNIDNKADISYVKWAHKNGYRVWALFDNGFDPDVTSRVLNDTEKREKVIRQLLVYARLYNLDGINIDFENVYHEDRDMLTQFVRELTPILHQQNLVVSMDVTVKSQSLNWSLCYDRKSLGEIVDYIALMAYDEHWATSPVSGPVASIGWVEEGIKTLLEEVAPSKVLLGLPFYTREWEETVDAKGSIMVKSKALSMAQARKRIKENNAKIIWNEETGTYFATYKKGDAVYKLWLEDAKSIELKASLVQKYNLAGTAAWRLGFEEKEVWNVLYNILKPQKI